MPTQIAGEAKGPTEVRTIDDALMFGRQQFSATWPTLSRQFSQPAMIKLAELTLGTKAIHSSQKHGFDTGKLRDASPKLLLAIGWLNLAIAKANGEDCESVYTVPMHLPELWRDRTWLKDAEGAPLGPTGVFEAFTGLIDLRANMKRHIPAQKEAEVCKEVGKYLRRELAAMGVDYIGEMDQLKQRCHVAEELIYGKKISSIELLEALPDLAALIDRESDQLWDEAIAPYLN